MCKVNILLVLEIIFSSLSAFSFVELILTSCLFDKVFFLIASLHSDYSQSAVFKTFFVFFFSSILFYIPSVFISHYRRKHYGCKCKKCLYRKDSSK